MAHAPQLLYQDSVCPVDPRRLFIIFLSFHPPESFETLDKMEREDEFPQFTPDSLFCDFHWARRTQQQNEPITGGLNGLASESWQFAEQASLYSEIRSSWPALCVGPTHSVRQVLQLENPFIVSHGCHCTESAVPNILLFSPPFFWSSSLGPRQIWMGSVETTNTAQLNIAGASDWLFLNQGVGWRWNFSNRSINT